MIKTHVIRMTCFDIETVMFSKTRETVYVQFVIVCCRRWHERRSDKCCERLRHVVPTTCRFADQWQWLPRSSSSCCPFNAAFSRRCTLVDVSMGNVAVGDTSCICCGSFRSRLRPPTSASMADTCSVDELPTRKTMKTTRQQT
jgi:hypothetical protein